MQAALLEYAVLDDDAEKILEKQGKTFERGKSHSDGAVIGGNLKITGEDRASWKDGQIKREKTRQNETEVSDRRKVRDLSGAERPLFQIKSKKKTYAFRAKQKSKAGDSDVCSEQ